MVKTTIGVPTYDGAHRVDVLLRSISARTPEISRGEAVVVLVDDGSPAMDATMRVYQRWCSAVPVTYVEHGINRGLGTSWNTAANARKDTELIVLVHDDVVVADGWLEALIYCLDRNERIGIVGLECREFSHDDLPEILTGKVPEQRAAATPRRVAHPPRQLFGFRREDFVKAGGFDERMQIEAEKSFAMAVAAASGKVCVELSWPVCFHERHDPRNSELSVSVREQRAREIYAETWANVLPSSDDVPIEYMQPGGMVARGVVCQDGFRAR